MTNRLIERSKFILPTNSDGLILTHFEEMIRESQKMELMFSDQSVVLAFNEKKNIKELVFPTFTITNQFPDNICLLKNGEAINNTQESLSQSSGFLSRSKFTNAFKKSQGMTPTAFIKELIVV